MNKISIDDLEKILNNKDVIIELTGIINYNIEIKNLKIKKDIDNIIMFSKDVKILKVDRHQIMRIECIDGEYFIYFDSMQKIKIKNRS